MKHLLANAGWSGLLRLLFVGLIMTLVAAMSRVPWSLAIWVLALTLGAGGGQWLAKSPEKGHPMLQGAGLVVTLAAAGLGIARDQLDLNLDTGTLIRLILLPTGLYLGAYLRFMSHPNVVIVCDSSASEKPDSD